MNLGGVARYVGQLVENIPDSKVATGFVQGLELEDPFVSRLTPIRIKHLGRKISLINDYKAWRELSKVVSEVKPEILHTHTFKAGLIGRLVRGSHKHVHTFHGHLFEDSSFSKFEKKVIVLFEKWLAPRSDVLVSVGLNVGKDLREAGIGVEQKWVSISPGVVPIRFADKIEARKSIGISESGIIIGWMGRMTSVKNPFLLIKVAAQLPEIQFVMAGGGELLESIRSIAPVNVNTVGWLDSSTFWSAVDIAISTSDNEGMPLSLIEAQLAGVPVIATNVGSNSEIVKHGLTGFIVEKDSNALIEAIRQITSSPTLAKTLGEKGRELADKEFSLKVMVRAHEVLYQELRA
jgi:glycosyltransferase involved in cell wall biosynthesis